MEVATTTTTTHRTHITPLVARTAHARRRAHRHTKQITSRSPPSTSSSTPSAHKRPRLRLRRICTQKLPPPSTERLPSCSLRSNTTTQSPMRQVPPARPAPSTPISHDTSRSGYATRASGSASQQHYVRLESEEALSHGGHAPDVRQPVRGEPAMTLPVAQAKSVEVSASGVLLRQVSASLLSLLHRLTSKYRSTRACTRRIGRNVPATYSCPALLTRGARPSNHQTVDSSWARQSHRAVPCG